MLPHLLFNETEILAFALVFIRITAFLLSWPMFSVYGVPNPVKVLFSIILAMLIFPVVDRSGLTALGLSQDLAWLAGKEALTGLCLGFLTRLFIFAVSIGGNLIATSVGLANAQLFNPALGATGTTVEQFYSALAMLLFLALNGHHIFLTGLQESFQAIPLVMDGTALASLSQEFRNSGLIIHHVMVAGIKISAPVLVALFVMNVVMGIIGRAVPQVNVLVTSMTVNLMAGLFVMIISIPALLLEFDREITMFAEMLFGLMKSL